MESGFAEREFLTMPAQIPRGKSDRHHAFRFSSSHPPRFCETPRMSSHIYKKIELIGSSPNSIEEAVQNAIAKASQSLRNLRWFEVVETRGHIEEGRIAHWQVTIKIGFTLED
jgi:flavin-binding protein dodecin